jgi:hypothetical protein
MSRNLGRSEFLHEENTSSENSAIAAAAAAVMAAGGSMSIFNFYTNIQ